MKYKKEYLKEQKFLFSAPALLTGFGIGSVADVIGSVVRPPLDLAKQIGHEKRINTLKRAGEQKFGGTQSELEKAIEAALGKERESIAGKIGQRGRGLYQNIGFSSLFGRGR